MLAKFYIFDRNDHYLFARSDAHDFTHYCKDFAFEGSFPPHDGYSFEAGQRIGWKDDDDNWEIHEIVTVSMDAFGGLVKLTGVTLALAELRDVLLEKYECKNKKVTAVVDELLNGTVWQRGALSSEYEEDAVDWYYVNTSSVYMYNKIGGKRIGKYRRNAIMGFVEDAGSGYYKVDAPDGRTGVIASRYLTLQGSGAGSKAALTYITIDEQTWMTPWALLETALAKAELVLWPRVEISASGTWTRYIDMHTTTPAYRGVRLSCDYNLKSANVEYDSSSIFTALYGIGKENITFADVVWDTSLGDPVNKPSGQKYVADPDALAQWGRNGRHRYGVITMDEQDDAAMLLGKTWEQLQVLKVPKVTIDATVADLYKMGYGGQSMRLYDSVYVILKPIGTRLEARIIDLERDLVEPENTRPTIGTSIGNDIVTDILNTSKYRR